MSPWRRGFVATTVMIGAVGCQSQAPPPTSIPITDLEGEPRLIEPGQLHADATGPIVQFGAGEAAGEPFVFSTYSSVDATLRPAARCVAIEFREIRAAGCIPVTELPDDDFFSRLQGGGSCETVNPEAGLIPSTVHGMWVELDGGDSLPATVVNLEPLTEDSAYYFFLPQGVEVVALVAADADGHVIERREVQPSPCRAP